MVEWCPVAIALILPWLTGVLWLRVLWRDPAAGVWPLVLGYGGLLGWLLVTLLLRAQAALGLPLNVVGPILVMALLALLGAWQVWRHTARIPVVVSSPWVVGWRPLLFGLLLAWLGVRFVYLALEIGWRPLYPWDAWTTWAVQPRVWAELGRLTPFVAPQSWLVDATGSVYALEAWNYPVTVPLLALWPTLAYGAWNETVANLPWLGGAMMLSLGFYGQARQWGVSALTALIFTWLLLSLPLLDTHVALAGYADLWLATVYGLAVIAFLHWARTGDRRQGLLALLLALASPLIKVEGVVWLLLLLPALLAARLRSGLFLALVGLAVVLGLLWGWTGGITFSVIGLGEVRLTPELIQIPYVGRFALAYRGGWDPFIKNFFILANWHLLAYLALLTVGVLVVSAVRSGMAPWQRAGLTWVTASLLALFVLFFMTDAQRWAEQYTSINRVFLNFAPALMFGMMTVWMPFIQPSPSPSPLAPTATAGTCPPQTPPAADIPPASPPGGDRLE